MRSGQASCRLLASSAPRGLACTSLNSVHRNPIACSLGGAMFRIIAIDFAFLCVHVCSVCVQLGYC